MTDQESGATAPGSLITTLVREPTVHFVIIAAIIFAVYGISHARNENVLEVDQREIDARIFMQEMATGEALSAEQRDFITASYIEEQILVQEALAIGLDNDARIHDMLAQKMRHVLSGDVIQPSESELEDYYRANLERYRTPPAIWVDELVLNSRDPVSEQVSESLQAGADPEQILEIAPGNTSPLPNVTQVDLSNIFAAEYAQQVFSAEQGQWTGPFVSNRGQHWLRVTERTESELPPLSEISDRVRLDWIATEEDARLQEKIDALWERYSISILDVTD